MIKEHDRVILTSDLPADGLKAGDVGTVIHIHGNDLEAFEVEFLTLHGETAAIATLSASQVPPTDERQEDDPRPFSRTASLASKPSSGTFPLTVTGKRVSTSDSDPPACQ